MQVYGDCARGGGWGEGGAGRGDDNDVNDDIQKTNSELVKYGGACTLPSIHMERGRSRRE